MAAIGNPGERQRLSVRLSPYIGDSFVTVWHLTAPYPQIRKGLYSMFRAQMCSYPAVHLQKRTVLRTEPALHSDLSEDYTAYIWFWCDMWLYVCVYILYCLLFNYLVQNNFKAKKMFKKCKLLFQMHTIGMFGNL